VECIEDIDNSTNNEFNILLTAKNVLKKKDSHKMKNNVSRPSEMNVKFTKE
jgi:hypothetical protein